MPPTDFIPVSEPRFFGEEQAFVLDCLKTGWISSSGPYIEKFEEAFARYCADGTGAGLGGDPHGEVYGIACANGTAALHLAVETLGIGHGDEVIVPDMTIIASANAVILAGARPVLAEITPDTWCLDPAKVEERITPRTRAIMPVHMYGHPCDMDGINRIARKHRLAVIEDACQAHGSGYHGKRAGVLGEIACFSFYANKNITTGEGGMIVTHSRELAEKARLLRNQAFSPVRFVHHELGFNYRLTNLQAAIGYAQTLHLDEALALRRRNARLYLDGLRSCPHLRLPVELPDCLNCYWMFGCVLEPGAPLTRDQLMEKLKEQGIDTRAFFYPLHLQPVYVKNARKDPRFPVPPPEGFPVSKSVGLQGLYLPSSLHLAPETIARVCRAVVTLLS